MKINKNKSKAKASERNMNKQKHVRPMQQVCNKEQKGSHMR